MHHHVCRHGGKLTQMLFPFYFSFVFPQEVPVISHYFFSSLRFLLVRENTSIKEQVPSKPAIYCKCLFLCSVSMREAVERKGNYANLSN